MKTSVQVLNNVIDRKEEPNVMVASPMPSSTPVTVTWRFRPLLVALLLILMLYPFIEEYPIFLKSLATAVLITGIYAVSRDRRILTIACVIAVPTIALEVLYLFNLYAYANLSARIGTIIFSGFTAGTILWHVLKEDSVTSDTLYGAICAYLLIGHTWTTLYVLLEAVHPGSFYVGAAQNPDQVMTISDLAYFSIVTLTTLGYGDITPVTSAARSFATLEALFGVLYNAILIARLVGLYRPMAPSPPTPSDAV